MPRGDRGSEYGRRREQRSEARDIADRLDAWVAANPRDDGRWGACREDFARFCRTYHNGAFDLPWSEDHRRVVAKIERSVLGGECFAVAMPRGFGKTTMSEAAVEWAVLYGHRDYVMLISATDKLAQRSLASISMDLTENDLLAQDFPGVIVPIALLENITQRARNQLWHGKLTHMVYTDQQIILPTGPAGFPGHEGFGGIIQAAGLTGAIRGQKIKTPDGRAMRPDLAILDDPQTDDSARSPTQNETRIRLITGAVLGLAGHRRQIAAIMPCTVIQEGDLADTFLNPEVHPEWNGERTKMVYAWPKAEKLWDTYGELYAKGHREGVGITLATEHYREHREEMDEGGSVAWPEKMYDGELSAIQAAWNLRLKHGYPAFMAEFQNEPLPDEEPSDYELKAADLMGRLNGLPVRQVHSSAATVTGFIDIQGSSLWYLVAWWAPDFTGGVCDYGVYPDQKGRRYYTLRDLRYTLAREFPKAGQEGQIYGGLDKLVDTLAKRVYATPTGGKMKLDRLLIDWNWHESTSVVDDYCLASPHSNILTPSRGSPQPIDHWKLKRGERGGPGWIISPPSRRVTRHVTVDTNYYKTFVAERFLTPPGDPGALMLYGKDADDHRCLADHCTSEVCKVEEKYGRKVGTWKLLPGRDNHWWDGLVGAAAAASIQGCKIEAEKQSKGEHGRRRELRSALVRRKAGGKSFSAMYREARGRK